MLETSFCHPPPKGERPGGLTRGSKLCLEANYVRNCTEFRDIQCVAPNLRKLFFLEYFINY